MNLRLLLGATAIAIAPIATAACADDLPPCDGCADAMTVVSWGGAYQNSQQKAYSEPYAALTGTKFTWDESSNEADAKLRAQFEAGNVTWDLVDVEGPDSQRLCDEGLALEIDADKVLAKGTDGSLPSADFGDSLINKCFIPQIWFSTTLGYRTDIAEWGGKTPTQLCDLFDLKTFPGKRALEKRPKKNLEWALLCDGVAKADLYDVLSTPEGVDRALAKLGTIKDQTVWWSAGAETPQLLADKEVVMGSTYNGRLYSVIVDQKQPVAMLWDYENFDFDGWIDPGEPAEGPARPRAQLPLLRDRHPAARGPGEVYLLRPGAHLLAAARRGLDEAAHAHQPRQHEELSGQQHRVVGRQPGRGRGQVPGLALPVTPNRPGRPPPRPLAPEGR